jgi:hypothetical protein
VGDFGNVTAHGDVAKFSFQDKVASLFGAHTIIGRTMVIHAGKCTHKALTVARRFFFHVFFLDASLSHSF